MGRRAIKIRKGSRFGRLKVIGGPLAENGEFRFPVRCDCGVEKRVTGNNLRSRDTQSCGCLGRERRRAAVTKHGQTTNAGWHPLYARWLSMKSRCYNPKFPSFQRYGARGIRVCKRWRDDFAAFLHDVGEPPSARHSLGRIDNDGDYKPGNVRWETMKEQGRNTRANVRLTLRGKTQCLTDWAEETGIDISTLSYRVRAGWTTKDALTTPPSFANRCLPRVLTVRH